MQVIIILICVLFEYLDSTPPHVGYKFILLSSFLVPSFHINLPETLNFAFRCNNANTLSETTTKLYLNLYTCFAFSYIHGKTFTCGNIIIPVC